MIEPMNREALMRAIFGRAAYPESFLDTDPDWTGFDALIDHVLESVRECEVFVLQHRFGIPGKTLLDIGKLVGVSKTRIRDIEGKTLRKLRHPLRSRDTYINGRNLRSYLPSNDTLRASEARKELYGLLYKLTHQRVLSEDLANRTTRSHLTTAIKAAKEADLHGINISIAASCRLMLPQDVCVLCDEPAIYPSHWCLSHYLLYYNKPSTTVLLCDGCGEKFIRSSGHIIRDRQRGGNEAGYFCSRDCFHQWAKKTNLYSRNYQKRAATLAAQKEVLCHD